MRSKLIGRDNHNGVQAGLGYDVFRGAGGDLCNEVQYIFDRIAISGSNPMIKTIYFRIQNPDTTSLITHRAAIGDEASACRIRQRAVYIWYPRWV